MFSEMSVATANHGSRRILDGSKIINDHQIEIGIEFNFTSCLF